LSFANLEHHPANDVIILMVRDQASAIIDSSGLSFKLRVSASFSEYYAIAKTPLRMDNVSVIFQGHCCPISQVFAIQGANTAIIFDPRPEFPQIVSKCGVHYGYACSATIETATHDFIIAGVLLADSGLNIGERPQAFTRIEATGLFEVDYHMTGHVEHNINFTIPIIGRNNVITAAYSIMLDAVSLKQ
jgi:hypothetical protein